MPAQHHQQHQQQRYKNVTGWLMCQQTYNATATSADCAPHKNRLAHHAMMVATQPPQRCILALLLKTDWSER
jgi:hypothetical protein